MCAKLAFLHWTYEDSETLSRCHHLPDLLPVLPLSVAAFPSWLADAPSLQAWCPGLYRGFVPTGFPWTPWLRSGLSQQWPRAHAAHCHVFVRPVSLEWF